MYKNEKISVKKKSLLKLMIKKGMFIVLMSGGILLNAQNITIKGSVADKISNENLAFANVMQMSDTSLQAKLINGVTTDTEGKFSLKVKQTNVVLKFSFLGYKENILQINTTKYKQNDGSIDIGTVFLESDAADLGEVSVIGKQTRLEMDNDKIVMNIDEGLTATSANVFEMLRKVPGVVIDKDENISLNGQSGVLFQFDGRDIRIPYEAMKSILKGMSPNDIAKIETINNPSAKYEAEGTAGIINIVMAGQQSEGFSGSLSSWNGINKDFKSFDNLSLNYVNSKWTITVGGGFGYMNGRNSMEMSQYIFDPSSGDTTLIKMDKDEARNKFRSFNGNISADYKINDNNSVGVMLSYNGHLMPDFADDAKKFSISEYPYTDILSSYSIKDKNRMRSSNYMGSVYFNHKFDTSGGQFSASFDVNYNDSYNKTTSLTSYYGGYFLNPLRKDNLSNDASNGYGSYAFKFDVYQPLSSKTSLEYGIKSRLATVDNDFKAYLNNNSDKNRTNHLKYKENVNAAYISFSDKFTEKLSLRAGLRFEHTYTNIQQKVTGENISDNYFDLFPNLNLSYRVGKTDNISLTYSYRISRPDYNSLNPFENVTSDYNIQSGNPYLKPEYTHKVDLNYAFHYLVFLTASYSYDNNAINHVMMTSPNSLTVTQKPYNIGYSQQASVGLSSMLPLGPAEWTLWLQGAYGQMRSEEELLRTNIEKFSFMTWQSLAVDFFFKSKLSLSCFYSSGGVQMGGEYSNMLMLSASLTKDFLNKALKVSIGVDNFPKRTFNVSTHYNNYRMNVDMCWQRPQFTINVSYNFGKKADNNSIKQLKSDDMDDRKSGESNVGTQQSSPMGR